VAPRPPRRARLTRHAATQLGTEFLGVLLNPPWASITPKQVEGLGLPKLCPVGFIFVWVEKEVLDQVVDVLVQQKYVYVENLTWVLMNANNRARARAARPPAQRAPDLSPGAPQVVQGAAPYTGRSHRTLLIFRRDTREFPKGKEIELRHQRSPDVEVQIANTAAGASCLVLPSGACLDACHHLPRRWTAPYARRSLQSN
jgi:hypothetical protein